MATTDKNTDTKVAVKPETPTAKQPGDMRQMRRWDPFEQFDELQNEMLRWWAQAFPPMARAVRRMAPTGLAPSTDVYEQNGSLVVKAELPGMKKEDIDVTLDRGDLLIRGERKAESNVKEDHYYRQERSYGSFYRRIPLPSEVTADQIKATYSDGVLEVRVPTTGREQTQQQEQKIPVT